MRKYALKAGLLKENHGQNLILTKECTYYAIYYLLCEIMYYL
jgi:hypothetical protein